MEKSKRSPSVEQNRSIDDINQSTDQHPDNKHHQDSLQEESKLTAAGTVGRLGENSLHTQIALDS
jgi:hypothetical protein